MDRNVEMGDGNQRFDAVLAAFTKQVLVEGQALLVRLRIVTVGEDARPRDGQAVGLESHLPKQGDVFLVAVVHIDSNFGWIVVSILETKHLALAAHHRSSNLSMRDDVDVSEATSAFVIRALALVCRRFTVFLEWLSSVHMCI